VRNGVHRKRILLQFKRALGRSWSRTLAQEAGAGKARRAARPAH
jgi:hypothetical protein